MPDQLESKKCKFRGGCGREGAKAKIEYQVPLKCDSDSLGQFIFLVRGGGRNWGGGKLDCLEGS